MYPLGASLLILTSTTLLRYEDRRVDEIEGFDYGITSSAISGDRQHLAISSNKVHVYEVESLVKKDMECMLKVVGVS